MTAPTPATPTRTYSLGAVLPHVRWAAEQVGTRFDVGQILGWRASAIDRGGHPAGLALDFMTSSSEQGWQIAAHLIANAEGYGVKYVIFEQKYREPGGGWEPMEDRGSPTQNHMDHVHASFTVRPGTRQVDNASGYVSDAATLSPVEQLFAGWGGDLLGVGIKLALAGGALALVVVGLNRTVTAQEGPK